MIDQFLKKVGAWSIRPQKREAIEDFSHQNRERSPRAGIAIEAFQAPWPRSFDVERAD